MKVSRWVLGFFLAVMLALVVVRSRLASAPSPQSERAFSGKLVEFNPDLVTEWQSTAVLEPVTVGTGEIVDLDVDADTLFLLRQNGWLKIANNVVVDSAGTATKGAPGWIARGVSLDVARDGIYVLDQARRVVLRFARTGELLAEIRLVPEAGTVMDPRSVRGGAAGVVYVVYGVWRRDHFPKWVVGEFASGSTAPKLRFEREDQRKGAAIVAPLLWVSPDGTGFVVDPLGYVLLPLDRGGREHARPDPPRYAIADSILKGQARLVQPMPEKWRISHSLPDSWPSVRRVSRMSSGEILLVLQAGPEEYTAEVIDSTGNPTASLLESPDVHELFPTSAGLFRIRHETDAVHIERRTLAR